MQQEGVAGSRSALQRNRRPGGAFSEITAKFRELRDRRVEQFAARVAEASTTIARPEKGDSPEDELVTDLYVTLCQRAGEHGDRFYHEALAHLIASAMSGRSSVHVVTYIANRIVRLEPIHVRILSLFVFDTIQEAASAGNTLAQSYVVRAPSTRTDDLIVGNDENSRCVNVDTYSRVLQIDTFVLRSCLRELSEAAFTDAEQPECITGLGSAASMLTNDVKHPEGSTSSDSAT